MTQNEFNPTADEWREAYREMMLERDQIIAQLTAENEKLRAETQRLRESIIGKRRSNSLGALTRNFIT